MSIKLANNFLIDSSLNWYAGFYQQLVGGISSFEELGNRVVKITEQVQAFRRYDKVKEAAQILANIPIKQYQAIGHYYMGLCEFRRGESPKEQFERVAENAPAKYRALAMQSLSLIEGRKQDYASELYWLTESLKVSPSLESLRGIAIVKAKEGYHQSAVKDLEKLYPLMRHVDTLTYYQYLNSLAVELAEVGRKYEARNVIKHVLESPLIIAYPEWRDTAEELREANGSFVAINPSPLEPRNVLTMPTFERDAIEFPAWAGRPAPVLSYQQGKERMAKKKKNGEKPVEPMNEKDMLIKILNIYTNENTTDETRFKIYYAVMKALSEPEKPDTPASPDDDTPGA